jgi:hypothetical protein
MKILVRFLFENSPFDAFWASWLAGFCVIGMDGQVYLSDAGQEYLDGAA